MEMDLESTIISAIAVIICALPFVLWNIGRRKREKIFLQSLSEIATQNNCQINLHEMFGNFAIGIDETKSFVYYYRKTKDINIAQSVDLSEIKSCKVLNKSRTLKNKGGYEKVLDRLELSFTPTEMNKPEIKMEFFNADMCLQLNRELQSIEKWSKLINDRLKHKK